MNPAHYLLAFLWLVTHGLNTTDRFVKLNKMELVENQYNQEESWIGWS